MSRLALTLAVAGAMTLGVTADAQQGPRPMGPPPGGAMMPGPGMGGPSGGVASMLLAHTGEFRLSDAQVTRLAAIARRTSDRHRAMRASMDSMRSSTSAPAAGDARPVPSPAMRAMAERLRDQERADLRDAIALLTPDQQAQGWEMMMRQGGRGGMGGARPQMVRREMMQRGARGRAGAIAPRTPPTGERPAERQPRAMRTRPPV